MPDLLKMDSHDYSRWKVFRSGVSDKINKSEFKLLCELHSKYYKHPYKEPCSCSPSTINKWIAQLNDIFENGF